MSGAAERVGPADAERDAFPLLASCVYLNSNSTGAFPRGARAAADAFYDRLFHWRDEAWGGFLEAMRAYEAELARLIGAAPGTIALDTSVSNLFARFLSALDFTERPRVVTSDLEFPSTRFILEAHARRGCRPVVVPSDGIAVDEAAVCQAIDERTKLVLVSHATFATGALTDLAPIVARAREVSAIVVVDAYQSIGVVPVDVGALDVDVVFGGAHKWLCGALDSAFVYVKPTLLATLEPTGTGWMAGKNPLSFATVEGYADDARRMTSGTPAPLAAITSREGLRLVSQFGMPRVREDSLRRTARIIERADALGLGVATPRAPSRRGGIVNLRFDESARATERLRERGFIVSHRAGMRVAPHFYNTDAEVERFMDALEACLRELRS